MKQVTLNARSGIHCTESDMSHTSNGMQQLSRDVSKAATEVTTVEPMQYVHSHHRGRFR